ncbi:hypothetical protein [Hymenobacter sp. YC55]|uniref:hypothetical protein n=1 Tax=Hymenobacter sp. YC55 TaxID=3034019 RepID=UPI0023F6F7A1|nr:hypothetical protein [Hymenobacter sp. YC55]MDF7815708.1 hypothetical protein [Hymenobacter sp. YC55]
MESSLLSARLVAPPTPPSLLADFTTLDGLRVAYAAGAAALAKGDAVLVGERLISTFTTATEPVYPFHEVTA